MILLQALLVAQVMECPLEPELRLAPVGDYRPLKLSRKAAARGFEAWGGVVRGSSVALTRRAADGAVGLVNATDEPRTTPPLASNPFAAAFLDNVKGR